MTQINLESGAALSGLPTFDARAMTGADGLAQIVLDEKVYTLRITRAGKLILTK
ncbi:hemin uptake protein HemP [Aliiruegeria haliotis]|nr:hemin uptake protein HemP [Aliiruegeria haliotis]